MGAAKTVRLRSVTGVVVETTEDVASKLTGFEAEKPAPRKRAVKSDDE